MNISVDSIEAQLRNRIMNKGTNIIRVGDDTLIQMNEIVDYMKEVTGFDDSECLTDEDMEFAAHFADLFETTSFGSPTAYGWLNPESDAVVNEVRQLIQETFPGAPKGLILPVCLVNKILNEERCYAV